MKFRPGTAGLVRPHLVEFLKENCHGVCSTDPEQPPFDSAGRKSSTEISR